MTGQPTARSKLCVSTAHATRAFDFSRDREPKGACTCRNIAVENARGRYVLFLDTDDLLAPFCLAQRVAVLDSQPDLDFAVFSMLLFTGSPRAPTDSGTSTQRMMTCFVYSSSTRCVRAPAHFGDATLSSSRHVE